MSYDLIYIEVDFKTATKKAGKALRILYDADAAVYSLTIGRARRYVGA